MSEKLPDILVLTALNAVKQPEGQLASPRLTEKVKEYEPRVGDMWGAFLDAEPGSLEEEDLARRKLGDFYLLKTAQRTQDPSSTAVIWNDRFNQASQELYGDLDPELVSNVAAGELSELDCPANADMPVIDLYKELAADFSHQEEGEQPELAAFREALFGQFAAIAEHVATLPEGPYDAKTVRDYLDNIRLQLAASDPDWLNWKVTNPPGKTMLAVEPSRKEIEVPDGRGPIKAKSTFLGLVFHELLVHAQRSVNGNKLDDTLMAEGLPGYLDFEEGLGIFFEYMMTGQIPDKIKDRYIDAALALGDVPGHRLSRAELIDLGINREQARAQARGETAPTASEVEKTITDHVNRLFRGGTGMPIYGGDGKIISQAVFNKDIVYYRGFVKVREYVIEQMRNGVEPAEIIAFLLSGKFDATSEPHVTYLQTRHNLRLGEE